jgi:hypothetical protein
VLAVTLDLRLIAEESRSPMKSFAALAALGLVLSIVAHGFALLGLPPPLGEATSGG